MSFPNAAELARNLTTYFIRNDDIINRWGNVISSYQNLPGLIGFWPMSSVQRSTGHAYDLSGQRRTLIYNGNPQYNIYNNIVPYIALDGTGDYLSRVDEVDLRVTGTESIYNSSVRGLTMGCWARVSAFPGANAGMMTKDAGGVNRSYLYFMQPTGALFGQMTSTGAGPMFNTGATEPVTINEWFFSAIIFKPSTKFSIFLNTTEKSNTTAVPASIFAGTSPFNIGAINGGLTIDCDFAYPFLSANALSNAQLLDYYNQSRVLFGV